MEKVLIYTDPHRGLTRKAHTTEVANRAREKSTGRKLLEILIRFHLNHNPGEARVFCLGDFFDRESNQESVAKDNLLLLRSTDIILAGNHDIPNRTGKVSTFQLLESFFPETMLSADQEKAQGFTTEIGQTLFCFAPHAFSQDIYDSIIEDLCVPAAEYQGYRILCLHCNYGLPPELVSNETVLNLSREKAATLLGTFHWILIGHEHNPKEDYDGRVKVIGSVFPTGFDNMTDKRVLHYDPVYGTFEEENCWSIQDGYRSCLASEAAHRTTEEIAGKYFELTDDLSPGEAQKIVVSLFQDGAFGVRLLAKAGQEEDGAQFTKQQFESLPQAIAGRLQTDKPHLVELYRELLNTTTFSPGSHL